MALIPYNTPTKLILMAKQQGHVVVAQDGKVTIDTGDETLTMSPEGIRDRSGQEITIDAAMDTVLVNREG